MIRGPRDVTKPTRPSKRFRNTPVVIAAVAAALVAAATAASVALAATALDVQANAPQVAGQPSFDATALFPTNKQNGE